MQINKLILKPVITKIIIALIPITLIFWVIFFKSENLAILLIILSVLTCLPILLRFEKKQHNSREFVLIAIMLALSVSGRFIFAPFSSFKPVTAIVIITGMYLGYEVGLLVGSLTPLISNIYFMQGMWTPFQMVIWGGIGLIAGILYKQLKSSKIVLCIFGALSGVAFSMFMDLWSTVWFDSYLNLERYITLLITSLPVMALYAVSNVVFLLILSKPIGKKLENIKVKYAIGKKM